MLDELEWSRLAPLLARSATPENQQGALDLYEEMTGLRETNINAVWHHRIADYGPPCTHCGKPLRTPKAKFCGACMSEIAIEHPIKTLALPNLETEKQQNQAVSKAKKLYFAKTVFWLLAIMLIYALSYEL